MPNNKNWNLALQLQMVSFLLPLNNMKRILFLNLCLFIAQFAVALDSIQVATNLRWEPFYEDALKKA